MAYSAKSQKDYNDKCIVVKLKYTPEEINECMRMKQYTKDNNVPMSVYIKQLIKNDLDSKQVPYIQDTPTQHDDI